MFRLNPAELKRQFKKLGLKNVEIEAPETEEVIIKLADGKTIVAPNPQVMIVRVPGGSAMIQVVAEQLEVIEEEASETQLIEEDVKFVAEQAGVSIEEARRALEEAGGDIAAALMLLAERKQAS